MYFLLSGFKICVPYIPNKYWLIFILDLRRQCTGDRWRDVCQENSEEQAEAETAHIIAETSQPEVSGQ